MDGLLFVASNFKDQSDFTIILGEYKWNVDGAIMSKASRYFNALCNGGFREAETREVRLKDDNACDFVRLLQFVHTNEYDRRPGDSNASKVMPLDGIVSEKDLSQEGWATKKPRDYFEIDSAVLALARYYDVPSLREFIATRLVLRLPFSDHYSAEERNFALFQVEFSKVFKVVSEDLHEMPNVTERMVDEVLNFWVREYNAADRTIPPLLDTEASTTPAGEGEQTFWEEVDGFTKDNESFAREMMLGAMRIARQGFGNFKWSEARIYRASLEVNTNGGEINMELSR